MLKTLVTAEEFDALPEPLQEHYKKQGNGSYALQAEAAGDLRRALDKERQLREESDRLLGELVPDLLDEQSATGFIGRREWKAKVTAAADFVREAREAEFDPQEWSKLRANADGKQPTESELQTKLNDATSQVRELTRKNVLLDRDFQARVKELESERGLVSNLAVNRDLQEALDAAKVTQPLARRFAGLSIREKRTITKRDKDGITVYVVDGDDEVPIKDYVRTWSESEEGKHFVDQVDNSGGGGLDRLIAGGRNGGKPPGAKVPKTEGLMAEKKLAAVFDGKSQ